MSLPPAVVKESLSPSADGQAKGLVVSETIQQKPLKNLKRHGWCNWGRKVEEPELKVSNRDYDVVIGYRETNDMVPFLPEVVCRVLADLAEKGATVDPLMPTKELKDVETRLYGVFFDFDSLVAQASRMGFQKRTPDGQLVQISPKTMHLFSKQSEDTFFTSGERIRLGLALLETLGIKDNRIVVRARENERHPLDLISRQPHLTPEDHVEVIHPGKSLYIFPVHSETELRFLKRSWVWSLWWQPIDIIRDYFGDQLALYFGFLGSYTSDLVFPSIFGLLVSLSSLLFGPSSWLLIAFASFLPLWGGLFIKRWRRMESRLTFHWGSEETEVQERILADRFKARLQKATQDTHPDGANEKPLESRKRRQMKYLLTVPASMLVVGVAVAVMLVFQFIEERFEKEINTTVKFEEEQGFLLPSDDSPEPNYWVQISVLPFPVPRWSLFLLTHIPTSVYVLCIPLLDTVNTKISSFLTDFEEHPTDTSTRNAHIIRRVIFKFFNNFISFFYVAFYLWDLTQLRYRLAMFLIIRQVVQNIQEVGLPLWRWRKKVKEVRGHSDTKGIDEPLPVTEGGAHEGPPMLTMKSRERASVQTTLEEYDNTFEDMIEMVNQFGQVTLFAAAFPVAPFLAFLNNIIEVRSDAFKLTTIKRPIPVASCTLGPWLLILDIVTYLSVVSNAAIVALELIVRSNEGTMDITATTVISIVILEHLVFLTRLLISYAMQDVPGYVQRLKYKKAHGELKFQPVKPSGSPVTASDASSVSRLSYSSNENRLTRLRSLGAFAMAVADFEDQLSTKSGKLPAGLIGQMSSAMEKTDLAVDQDVSALNPDTTLANLRDNETSSEDSHSPQSSNPEPMAPQPMLGGEQQAQAPPSELPPPFPVSTAQQGALQRDALSPSAFTPRRNSGSEETKKEASVTQQSQAHEPQAAPATQDAKHTPLKTHDTAPGSEVSTPGSVASRASSAIRRRKRIVRRKKVSPSSKKELGALFTPEAVERSKQPPPNEDRYHEAHHLTQPLTASTGASVPPQPVPTVGPLPQQRLPKEQRSAVGSALADALHSAMESTIDYTCFEGPPARRGMHVFSKEAEERRKRGELPKLKKAEALMDIVSEQVEASQLRTSDPEKPIDWDEVRDGLGNNLVTAVILGTISLLIFFSIAAALTLSADILLILTLFFFTIGGIMGGRLIVVHNPGILPVTDKPLIEAWKEAQEHPEGRVANAGIWDLLCCRCKRLGSRPHTEQQKTERKERRLKKTANFVKNLPGKLWKKKERAGEEAGTKMPVAAGGAS